MIKSLLQYLVYGDIPTWYLRKKGLKVGRNFQRQSRTIIDKNFCHLITIGDNVTLAPGCYLLAHDASTKQTLGYTRVGQIKIGNNVFIGSNALVMPGVTIGNNVIIGSSSVVTKDIPSNAVCAGIPARKFISYENFMDKKRDEIETQKKYGVGNNKISRINYIK